MAARARFTFDRVFVIVPARVAAVGFAHRRAHQRTAANIVRATGQFLIIGFVANHMNRYTRLVGLTSVLALGESGLQHFQGSRQLRILTGRAEDCVVVFRYDDVGHDAVSVDVVM